MIPQIFVKPPAITWPIITIGIAIGLLTPNPILTVASLLILPLLVFPLWRRGEPPVFPFIIFWQWLEVTTKVFHADFLGLTVIDMFGHEGIEQAIWLGLGATAVLAAGMRFGLTSSHHKLGEKKLSIETSFLSIKKLFIAYIITIAISSFLVTLAWKIPQLTQIILSFLTIKWAILFILVYTILRQKKYYQYLIIVFFLENFLGFITYFSNFKGIFFLFAVAFLTINYRLKTKFFAGLLTFVLFTVLLGVVWTSIKVEYRHFLNQGTGQQVVLVPVSERIEKLTDLVINLDTNQLATGLEHIAARIAYVDFFAHTLSTVPEIVPHENGALWQSAIAHILMPRLLFPNKPALIGDSEITRKYTGIMVAGAEQGTSIGIGYVAESYVDFGYVFMFVPIFLLGFMQGIIYNYFIFKAKSTIIGYGMVTGVLVFSAFSFETAAAKILGGTLMSFIVLALALKYLEMPFIARVKNKQPIKLKKSYVPMKTKFSTYRYNKKSQF